jgi:hypothetical protein
MANYHIPLELVKRYGPFTEFKADASIVSVELASGEIIGQVLLIYPNQVLAIYNKSEMEFDPNSVVRVFQSEEDLKTRTSTSWSFFDIEPTSLNK